MKAKLCVLPGDGIGPEVTAEAVKVLEAVARKAGHTFEYEEHLLGGCSIDRHGTALTDETPNTQSSTRMPSRFSVIGLARHSAADRCIHTRTRLSSCGSQFAASVRRL